VNDVTIQVRANGPYKVTGGIELLSQEGKTVRTEGGAVFLCRCGASTNKPFCDGTHSKIGFRADMATSDAAES